MKLYDSRGACSQVPHIVLRECALGIRAGACGPGQRAHRGRCRLRGDRAEGFGADAAPLGQTLTEGPAIAQYLADLAGNTALMPAAGTMARYRVMGWQNFISTELHKSFSPLFKPSFDDAAKANFSRTIGERLTWVEAQLGTQPI